MTTSESTSTRLVLATPAKFPLGQVVMTANAHDTLHPLAVADALRRHAAGDWGTVGRNDQAANEDALTHGGRLLSVYGTGDTRFWIITEADRSVTTVLLPEDY
jgi:hypothetical protein